MYLSIVMRASNCSQGTETNPPSILDPSDTRRIADVYSDQTDTEEVTVTAHAEHPMNPVYTALEWFFQVPFFYHLAGHPASDRLGIYLVTSVSGHDLQMTATPSRSCARNILC